MPFLIIGMFVVYGRCLVLVRGGEPFGRILDRAMFMCDMKKIGGKVDVLAICIF